MTHGSISTYLPQCINDLHALMLIGFCFYSWRLKVLVFIFKEVEGSFLKKLKVFVLTFECWRYLLILLDVEGFYFYLLILKGYHSYSWMLKVLIFGFKCWKFLLLFLKIEGSYFCSWMLKVLVITFKCWRFLLLDVEGSYFYSWIWRFVIFSFLFIYIYFF